MSNKKTLVILTPGFPKDESDSTCLPMQQQLVKAFKEIDPALNIIILSFQYPYHRRKYDWFGIPVIPFNGQNKGGITRLLLRKKILRTLKEIHSQTPVTALLSFWYGECAVIGKLFADKTDLLHFCWILGQDAKKENKYPKRIGLKPGELIALSDTISTEFENNHGVKPAHLITPGIDTSLFDTTPKKKSIDILGVGSLIPLKRYEIFVEVIAAIKKRIPGVKAELVGNGPDYDKLATLIDKLDLQHNLLLVGELPYQQVLERMQRSNVFLHPSNYEGFSGVCLEALFAGAHVISFCKPMNTDIEQYHIVSSNEEMIEQAGKILQNRLVAKSVLYSSIKQSAIKMLTLFFQGK